MLDKIIPSQLLIFQLISFVVGMTLIWFIYLRPLFRHVNERNAGIREAMDKAEKARQETERLHADSGKELEKVRLEARQILDEARQGAAQAREEILGQARKDAAAVVQQAQNQVAVETEAAIRQIRTESAALVVAATRKLLEKNLDEKSQEELAARFIKELEKA